jgi:hypothetical protein
VGDARVVSSSIAALDGVTAPATSHRVLVVSAGPVGQCADWNGWIIRAER